jgi:hypothetical protein
MVSVTGYRKLLRMTLPVLEERAEEKYHRKQRRTNLIVLSAGIGIGMGNGSVERELEEVCDRVRWVGGGVLRENDGPLGSGRVCWCAPW